MHILGAVLPQNNTVQKYLTSSSATGDGAIGDSGSASGVLSGAGRGNSSLAGATGSGGASRGVAGASGVEGVGASTGGASSVFAGGSATGASSGCSSSTAGVGASGAGRNGTETVDRGIGTGGCDGGKSDTDYICFVEMETTKRNFRGTRT